VTDADQLNFAVAHSVADRIKRIGNQAEYVRDANLFEHINQGMGYRLRHQHLLIFRLEESLQLRQIPV
jgi:hypothetical protein